MLRNIKYTLLLIMTIAITACEEDFLETKPTDAISANDALATAENMALILNGLHRGLYSQLQTILPGGSSTRAGNHYWVPMGDNHVGGIIHSANANNLGWRDEMQWNSHTLETSNTTRLLWYHRYNIIASANAIINKATDGSIPEDDRLREIIGQAYTYRAYAYLSLIQHPVFPEVLELSIHPRQRHEWNKHHPAVVEIGNRLPEPYMLHPSFGKATPVPVFYPVLYRGNRSRQGRPRG